MLFEPRRQTRGSAHLVGWTRVGHWWGYNMWLGLGRDMGLCNLEAEVKPPSECTQISGLRFSLSHNVAVGGRHHRTEAHKPLSLDHWD